jgi:hypothetical protein
MSPGVRRGARPGDACSNIFQLLQDAKRSLRILLLLALQPLLVQAAPVLGYVESANVRTHAGSVLFSSLRTCTNFAPLPRLMHESAWCCNVVLISSLHQQL